MEVIKEFTFNEKLISVYGTPEAPYFKGKEIGRMLDYTDTDKAVRKYVDEDDKKNCPAKVEGQLRNVIMINESGLYSLILSSKKPEAKNFKRWITSDVLPTIRTTGKYELQPVRISDDKRVYINNEEDLQKNIIKFLRERQDKYNLKIVVPLGELQDTSEKRIYSRQMGYEKGQPDIIINNASIHHDGVIIELKSPKGTGKLSEEQKSIIKRYKDDKYKIIVSNDQSYIIEKLVKYFSHLRLRCRKCNQKFKTVETRENHLRLFHKVH